MDHNDPKQLKQLKMLNPKQAMKAWRQNQRPCGNGMLWRTWA